MRCDETVGPKGYPASPMMGSRVTSQTDQLNHDITLASPCAAKLRLEVAALTTRVSALLRGQECGGGFGG